MNGDTKAQITLIILTLIPTLFFIISGAYFLSNDIKYNNTLSSTTGIVIDYTIISQNKVSYTLNYTIDNVIYTDKTFVKGDTTQISKSFIVWYDPTTVKKNIMNRADYATDILLLFLGGMFLSPLIIFFCIRFTNYVNYK
jgi:hypothetical protein